MLLRCRADVNAEQAPKPPQTKGHTPLDLAHLSGHRFCINLLQARVWWLVSVVDGDGDGTRGVRDLGGDGWEHNEE